jgi:uncharacterized Zn ribbon protein
MNTNCKKGSHDYVNNEKDAYICKECGKIMTFDEVEK